MQDNVSYKYSLIDFSSRAGHIIEQSSDRLLPVSNWNRFDGNDQNLNTT